MTYYMNFMMSNLILLILILISIAFTTLLERKILGLFHLREGPNKTSIMGIMQPFSDAIKLFLKENTLLKSSNYMLYLISPIMTISFMLILWMNYPSKYLNLSEHNILFMICLLSMNVYPMMIMGWSSNSMYAMLGAIRSIAQTISYEVSMILIMLTNMMLTESFNIMQMHPHQIPLSFMTYLILTSYMFFMSLMAELNRTPFDLTEGESELVSGFNTEYMSGSFTLIFLAEYGMILFMCHLYTMFFWMDHSNTSLLFQIKVMTSLFYIIFIRALLPRMRYDNMMMCLWKHMLPSTLNTLLFHYFMKCLIIY